jgi:hypothetical protein
MTNEAPVMAVNAATAEMAKLGLTLALEVLGARSVHYLRTGTEMRLAGLP